MKPAEPALTREQLQLAWRQLWRPGWPPRVEDLDLSTTRGKCVQGLARQMSRTSCTPGGEPSHQLPSAPVPPTQTAPPRKQPSRSAPAGLAVWPNQRGRIGSAATQVDRKRAAAGDRDE